jgi:hypothetical protein
MSAELDPDKTIFSVGAVFGAVALLKKRMNDDKRKQAR